LLKESRFLLFRRLWLFDLAKSSEIISSAVTKQEVVVKYSGFDISRTLFPHEAWLPKNVTLETADLLAEPPAALHGLFDVVHLRLVLSLIRGGSPGPVIRHLKMLLSPYLPITHVT
jgi:hypothetical protein